MFIDVSEECTTSTSTVKRQTDRAWNQAANSALLASFISNSTLKIMAVHFSETSLILHHIQEDPTPQ
jgi:hypothetical protein